MNEMNETNETGEITLPIKDVIDMQWMAKRYADGRCTYTPLLLNEITERLLARGVTLNKAGDQSFFASDGNLGEWVGGGQFERGQRKENATIPDGCEMITQAGAYRMLVAPDAMISGEAIVAVGERELFRLPANLLSDDENCILRVMAYAYQKGVGVNG